MLRRKSTNFIVSCALMTLANATGAFAGCDVAPVCPPKPACAPKPVCPPKPCCKPVVCPPMPEDCCMRNICTPTGVITPRVDLITGDSMDWFITADFTYWTAREENLEFASTQFNQLTDADENVEQGEVFRPGNTWRPGFKVGFGSDFCHDGWDVYAEYTWFHTHSKKSTGAFTGEPAGSIAPALLDSYWFVDAPLNSVVNNNAGASVAYTSGSATWHLKMNVVDLELGRNFYISPRLMLRPFCGLKGSWQKQEMEVTFNITDDSDDAQGPIVMENDVKNWGIGIRTGMNTSWHFSRCFSIIGDLALTGLWENFKAERFDTELVTLTGVVSSQVNFKETQHHVKPVIEWALGVKWETGFSCDAYHLAISAAWEEQVWFGQNQFLRLPGNAVGSGGDLSLQGLTVDARFDF